MQGGFSLPRPTFVVSWILGLNATLWLLFAVFINTGQSTDFGTLYGDLTLTPREAIPGFQLWQLVTYAWLHELSSLSHLVFNCLGVYFFGTTLERRWGASAFLRFYLWSVLISGFVTALIGLAFPVPFGRSVVGASGAVFALIAAFTMLYRHAKVLLAFVFPVSAKNLIWIALGLDLVLFFGLPHYNVAIHTHLGGALAGYLLISGNWRPSFLWMHAKRIISRARRPKLRAIDGGKARPKPKLTLH